MFVRRSPPELSVSPSWREIYLEGGFAQRELISESALARQAKERSIDIGIGRKPFEDLDGAGALQPIAFADGGYWSGFILPAIAEEAMSFREENGALDWQENYAWDAHGHLEVSALYSPWQLLYLDDVVSQAKATIPFEALLLDSEWRDKALESIRGFYEAAERDWRLIDDGWRPLLKVLVALQNHYWPQVGGRVTLLPDPVREADWIEAGRDGDRPSPADLLARLGCGVEKLIRAYHFLVLRGVDREPVDGLVMLRRARPRPFQSRWRGDPRRAQDNFDAAEVLRLFLVELTGEPVPAPEATIMDGRQAERATLFSHGPAATVDREKLKRELVEADLYPHGVEVMVEGASEIRLVDVLIVELIGPVALEEISYFNLEGVGAAKQVVPLAESLGGYAMTVFLMVDREGRMGSYAQRAAELGNIDPDDICLANRSLEEDNSSPAELLEIAGELAAVPAEGVEPVQLSITVSELLAAHQRRLDGTERGQRPGLAGTLVKLALNHDPPARLGKADLAEGLAKRMAAEFEKASANEAELAGLYERRPVLRFVIGRIIKAINRPIPVG
jgi:hypothetical protein